MCKLIEQLVIVCKHLHAFNSMQPLNREHYISEGRYVMLEDHKFLARKFEMIVQLEYIH